jgi:hypothetical protein
MTPDFFGVVRVADFDAALAYYERLFGRPFAFRAHETEVVWEIAEHRYVAVKQGERPGQAEHVLFVDDLDAWVDDIASRGIEPDERETYANGVRKAIYRDPDGNELGIGGGA